LAANESFGTGGNRNVAPLHLGCKAAAMAEGAAGRLGEAGVNRPPDPGAPLAESTDDAERRAIRKAQRDAKRYRLIEKHVRNVVRRGHMRTRVKQAVVALGQASENLKALGKLLDDASGSDASSEVFEGSPLSEAGDDDGLSEPSIPVEEACPPRIEEACPTGSLGGLLP
jgi:hypothetical protein